MGCARPSQELKSPTTRNGSSARRPDRERGAIHVLVTARVRTEHVPQPPVRALADQMEVDVTQRWPEAIGILRDRGPSAGIHDLHSIRARVGREVGHEDPRLVSASHDDLVPTSRPEDGLFRARPPHPDHPAAFDTVRPEHVMRGAVRPRHDACEIMRDVRASNHHGSIPRCPGKVGRSCASRDGQLGVSASRGRRFGRTCARPRDRDGTVRSRGRRVHAGAPLRAG